MKVLVTGGGGFLGGAILRKLKERGVAVRSFSRGHYPALEASGVECFSGDLEDYRQVKEACRGVDAVVHVAAKAGIWGDPGSFYRTNVGGTEHVVRACRRLGISRLVYTSSPSVVFDGSDMEGVDESVSYPRRFNAAYPATKAVAERHVLGANGERLATVALRPHLIWGPGDNHLIPGILNRARAGRLRRIGRTDKRVDFTYIEDAAHAHLLALDRLQPGSPIAGRPFFITQGEPVYLWEFINSVLALDGLPPLGKPVPAWLACLAGSVCEMLYRGLRLPGEPRLTRFLAEELSTSHWFDITAARNLLGYQPRFTMQQGLSLLGNWLRLEAEKRGGTHG